MRTRSLGARVVNYRELVGTGGLYSVPPHQSGYSWTEAEWDDLWREIVALRPASDARHYLGALVVQPRSDRESWVLDGQRRLATLAVLALSVISRLRDLAERGVDPDANRIWAQRLRDRFVGAKHPSAILEPSGLSLTATDDGFFRDYLVQVRTPANPRALPGSNRLLYECFLFFKRRLTEADELGSSGESLVNLLEETISRQLLFVLITVEDEPAAYSVFETMNARGLRLTSVDLLKNYLFSKCRVDSDRDLLERQWMRIVSSVTPERFPDFLRCHLLTEHRAVSRSRLLRTVEEQVRTPVEVFGLLEQLEARAELFAALSDPHHEHWAEAPEARIFIGDLARFGVDRWPPLLFAAWERFSREDFVRTLKLLVAISFRRQVVSGLDPNALESAGAAAARAVLQGAVRDLAAVSAVLESVLVPDEKTALDFGELRLTTRGRQKRVARYILARLESDASGRDCDPDSDSATIEHILPEHPDDSWESAFPFHRHEHFLYRLGNLTLLERQGTRDIGDRPYADKVAAYEGSRYTLTRQVAEMAPEEWTPALIEHRQKKLAARAVQIWRNDFA